MSDTTDLTGRCYPGRTSCGNAAGIPMKLQASQDDPAVS